MNQRNALLRWIPAVLVLLALSPLSLLSQAADEYWVASWATAQELYQRPSSPAGGASQQGQRPEGQGFRVSGTFNDQTVRMIVRPSIGGDRARIKLANAFGAQPITVGAATMARHAGGSSIIDGSSRAVTFGGSASVTVSPGVVVLSDPIDIDVVAGADLAVSLYFPEETGRPTLHPLGLHTTYISPPGDFTADATLLADTTTQSYYWLAAVDVIASDDAGAVVGFGDSITDGAASTPNANQMWPALLAERIADSPLAGRVAVVNTGISGNRVLSDGAGVSALARFDRDVLSQSGVRWVILLEGINDIGGLGRANSTSTLDADQLIWAYRQIIARAHAAGVKVVGGTLTPFEGAGYYSERGEAVRQAVNAFIRSSGEFDAVVDFDAATRDPANPGRFLPAYDPGDHLHPNDAGYRAMAEAIDLSIFSE